MYYINYWFSLIVYYILNMTFYWYICYIISLLIKPVSINQIELFYRIIISLIFINYSSNINSKLSIKFFLYKLYKLNYLIIIIEIVYLFIVVNAIFEIILPLFLRWFSITFFIRLLIIFLLVLFFLSVQKSYRIYSVIYRWISLTFFWCKTDYFLFVFLKNTLFELKNVWLVT